MRLLDVCFIIVLFSICFQIIVINFPTIHGSVNAWWMGPLRSDYLQVQSWSRPLRTEIFLLKSHMKLIVFLNHATNSLSQLVAENPKSLMSGGSLSIACPSFTRLFDLPAVWLGARLWAIRAIHIFSGYMWLAGSSQLLGRIRDWIRAELSP